MSIYHHERSHGLFVLRDYYATTNNCECVFELQQSIFISKSNTQKMCRDVVFNSIPPIACEATHCISPAAPHQLTTKSTLNDHYLIMTHAAPFDNFSFLSVIIVASLREISSQSALGNYIFRSLIQLCEP
jgi:hypothetical protein